MSKYYKHKNGLIVKLVKYNTNDFFTGIVVCIGDSGWKLREPNDYFYIPNFEPYIPTPQELIEWGETATLKYMKSIDPETKGLVVKFIEDGLEGEFKGIVANPGETNYYFGQVENRWIKSWFEPYAPKENPLTNDNPNKAEVDDKDINLRLDCLKLALQRNISDPLIIANDFYDWITTNQ